MAVQLANNASSKLASAITSSATTLNVRVGDGIKFPSLASGGWFPLTIVKADGTFEIVRATSRSGDAITVQRAQEGTIASAFSADDRVELRLTKAAFDDIITSTLALLTGVALPLAGGTLTGAVTLAGNAVDALNPVPLQQLTSVLSGYLPLAGGTFSGAVNEKKGSDIASAATTNIGAATGNVIHITGTTAITAFDTIQAGTKRIVVFDGSLVLTHDSTKLILPTGANIITQAGDMAEFVSEGAGNWRCTWYTNQTGLPIKTPANQVRQTVYSGAKDANGYANILSVGSGLVPKLLATSVAVMISFAAGFDKTGALDYTGQFTADTNFPACIGSQVVSSATNAISCVITTAAAHNLAVGSWVTLSGFTPTGYNGTYQITAVTTTTFTITLAAAPGATTVIGTYTVANFLYADRSATTGALTLGATILPPNYQYAPASVNNPQHTFVIPEMVMYVGNGSTASAVQRVFLGECQAAASTIASVTSYAFRGIYDSGLFAVAANTAYSKVHNIGVRNCNIQQMLADDVNGLNERPGSAPIYNGTIFYGCAFKTANRNQIDLTTMAGGVGLSIATGAQTSGYYRILANRGNW